MSSPAVKRVSECFIKPSLPIKHSNPICNLTTWDIAMLSTNYIQKGLLFKKPNPLHNPPDFIDNLLEKLKNSLSLALSHFYPLSGRLVTQKTQDPPSYVIFVDCSDDKSPGARFIYATLDMTVSDILSPVDVPPIVQSFFDLHKAVNHDGHTLPLLSIQVTELLDGVFIGCSWNHGIGDGTSYWNFFNTWSEIFRSQSQVQGEEFDVNVPISHNPIHNRWFPEGYGPQINLPFKNHDEFIARFERPKLRERIFQFSAETIAKLKEKANSGLKSNKISSFQSLSGFVWRSITRARRLSREQTTRCNLAINNRGRMEAQLAKEYFGNAVDVVSTECKAGELLEKNLGFAAWKVHESIGNHNDKAVRERVKEWLGNPVVYQVGLLFDPYCIMIGSSPRFDMYGNEFGMGKAVGVRSGYANKFDGNVTAYPGYDGGGSVDLEVCLSPETMTALQSDQEFINVVNPLF